MSIGKSSDNYRVTPFLQQCICYYTLLLVLGDNHCKWDTLHLVLCPGFASDLGSSNKRWARDSTAVILYW